MDEAKNRGVVPVAMLDSENPYDMAMYLLGSSGAMLSASKTAAPEREVVWNANVLIETREKSALVGPISREVTRLLKIWHGDLSITERTEELQALADKFGKVYVLSEMDARFEHENDPQIQRAIGIFERGKAPDVDRNRLWNR